MGIEPTGFCFANNPRTFLELNREFCCFILTQFYIELEALVKVGYFNCVLKNDLTAVTANKGPFCSSAIFSCCSNA